MFSYNLEESSTIFKTFNMSIVISNVTTPTFLNDFITTTNPLINTVNTELSLKLNFSNNFQSGDNYTLYRYYSWISPNPFLASYESYNFSAMMFKSKATITDKPERHTVLVTLKSQATNATTSRCFDVEIKN